jgi:hypothetical protein
MMRRSTADAAETRATVPAKLRLQVREELTEQQLQNR